MCKEGDEKLTLKIVNIVISSLYLICGMFLFIFGIVLLDPGMSFIQHRKLKPFDFNIVPNNMLQSTPIFDVVYGLLVMVTSCYGLWVVVKEMGPGIKIYMVSIVVAFIIGLVYLGVSAFFPSLKMVKNEMSLTMIKNFQIQDVHVTGDNIQMPSDKNGLSWSRTQFMAGCCGVDGPMDYANLTEEMRSETFPDGKKILLAPLSCCKTKISGQIASVVNDFINYQECLNGTYSSMNNKPCYIPPNNYTWMNFGIAMGLGWTNFGLQIRLFFNCYSYLQILNWTPA